MTDEAPARPPTQEHAELVRGLRSGDPTAFDRAYATFHPRIFSFLLRLSGRRDTAEDLAQETWLKLAKAAPGLREDTMLAPLLFTIARNSFVSHRRWAMLDLSRIVTLGIEVMGAEPTAPTPEAQHERARSMALLERGLTQISVGSREVLLLVGVEGMEQDEVAKILGVSYDALRQRLSRARKELSDTMASIEAKQGRRRRPQETT